MSATLFAPDQRSLTIGTMAAIAMAAYNNLSVSAALPAIGDELGNLNLLPWVVTIELVASAVATLAVGPVIDAVGTRVVFRWSVVLFTLACTACAFAPNLLTLIVARGFQGLTTGAIIANVMAAVGLGVPLSLRARAYAANSSVWGMMGLAGPAIAAAILAVSNWSMIFLVNLPVAAVAGFVGWSAFPGPTDESSHAKPDRRGLLLVATFAVLSLGAFSTLAWWTPLAALASIAVVVLYARHERSVEPPVLRWRHVTSAKFRMLNLSAFLVITAGICANTFLPVYVKGVRGATTSQAAFAVVFVTAGWTGGAFLSSRVSEKSGGERAVQLAASALAVSAIGAAVAVGLGLPLWVVFLAFTGVGSGMGGFSSAGVGLLQAKAMPGEMGRVNSAHQFIRTLGFTYGAAIGGALVFTTVERRLGDADVVRDLLGDEPVVVSPEVVDALRIGFSLATVVAAVLAVAAWIAATRLSRSTGDSADSELAGQTS